VILVDTSAWIAFFRDRGAAAGVVDRALEDDLVAWARRSPTVG
jgi:predicted nucleic acid-binding protein